MKKLTSVESKSLLQILEDRFKKNINRHSAVKWEAVLSKLEANPEKLWSLNEMERTGGEPDVIGENPETGAFIFYDCSAESPAGRRSLCFDSEALDARKENKPIGNALEMAEQMGVELLNEEQYRALQKLGRFDAKTSSWIQTPVAIRKLGGALFADFRDNTVFVYHNGAQSYYAARGFRAGVEV
jgi:hypothetical protein